MRGIFLAFWVMVHGVFSLCQGGEFIEPVTGQSFPSEVSFYYEGKNYDLEATGASSLKMLGFKIYGIAHYLQKGALTPTSDQNLYTLLLQDNAAKQFTLKYVMGASVRQVQKGIRDAFKSSVPEPTYSELAEYINYYISLFNQPIRKGDEQVIRWIPGGTIQLIINGQEVGNLTNPTFAQALWDLWFGPKSPVDRAQLLSMLNN